MTPIAKPKIPANMLAESTEANDKDDDEATPEAEDAAKLVAAEAKELEELHKMGIPVPGVEIKVDKMVAKVWLRDLEVECGNKVFGDRVRAVVERAVEVVAPLWA